MAKEWRNHYVYRRLEKILAVGTDKDFLLDKQPQLQQVQTPSIAMTFQILSNFVILENHMTVSMEED